MKKTLSIIGAGVVAGAVAYTIWNKMHKQEKPVTNNYEHNQDDNRFASDLTLAVNEPTVEDDIGAVKTIVQNNITDRHTEAAQYMKDTLVDIDNRSQVAEDETKELEQISAELDELLSEG